MRREFAPVRGLRLNIVGDNIDLTVEPRRMLDLPAYTLRNYYVVVDAYGADNQITDSKLAALPEIRPGDQAFQVKYKTVKGAIKYKASLLSPLQYNLLDTTLYLFPPAAPEVKEVQQSKDKVRIYFTKSASTAEVSARYNKDGIVQSTKSTINDFIDIPVSQDGTPLSVELVARNALGESKNNRSVDVASKFGIITPAIYKVGSVENGFMIGYESEKTDYLYQVEYQLLPDSTVYREQSPSRGVMIINDIENGKEVKFRFRKLDQTNAASEWSSYYTVTSGLPKEKKEIKDLQLTRVKSRKDNARVKVPEKYLSGQIDVGDYWSMNFNPIEFANAYEVRFYDSKGLEVYSEVISKSNVSHYIVPSSRTGRATSAKVFALFD